jgi:hypothetical protein
MRRIFDVYVVENASSISFEAREKIASSSVTIKSNRPGMLAKAIREEAKDHIEKIGISFQCPFEIVIAGTGNVSSEKSRPLSNKEREKFNRELNAAY